MSYIPNYNNQTDKFDSQDQEFIRGFDFAIESMRNFFFNLFMYQQEFEELEEENAENIEILDSDEYEKEKSTITIDLLNEGDKYTNKLAECFEDYADMERTEIVCAIAEQDKYDDVEFVDEDKDLFAR